MDGIERIIAKIEGDAESTAASVIADAKETAASIIAEAEAVGEAEAKIILAAAEADREKLIARAYSSGEQLKKRTLLARRVKIIDSVIMRAVESFVRTNPTEYFDAMKRLAVKFALSGEQEMVFSDRDIERLPEGFEMDVNAAIAGRGRVTVRGGGGFSGGFLLVGDDVVENCTMEALLEEYDTEIRDELGVLLFKQ